MTLHALKLVTIVCEALAREAVLEALAASGVHGWTIATVEGSGPGGARGGEIPELANIRVEVLLQPFQENLGRSATVARRLLQ